MVMGITSEPIHSLIPVFMVTTLDTSIITVGIIKGVAEATATSGFLVAVRREDR